MLRVMNYLMCAVFVLIISGCSTTSLLDNDDIGVKTHRISDIGEMEEMSHEYKMTSHYNQIYYYPFDNNTVAAEDEQSIKVQAEYLVEHRDSKVFIAGHTDSRGSAEYNIALGERRAKSIVSLLIKFGVKESQIKSISYGEEKPAVLGDSEAAYKWNRRSELKFEDF